MARGTWPTIRVATPVSATATAYGTWILPGSLWQGSRLTEGSFPNVLLDVVASNAGVNTV